MTTTTTPPPLAGLARALIAAGKLSAAAGEELSQKALASKTSFASQLVASGVLSAADLAHHVSGIFGIPLVDVQALDTNRIPKDLLDSKLCASYEGLPLAKRGSRLVIATADPTNK